MERDNWRRQDKTNVGDRAGQVLGARQTGRGGMTRHVLGSGYGDSRQDWQQEKEQFTYCLTLSGIHTWSIGIRLESSFKLFTNLNLRANFALEER